MKTQSLLFLILTILPFSLFSQGGLYSENSNEGKDLCNYFSIGNSMSENENVENLLQRIVSSIGINKNFYTLPCANVDNAMASAYKGKRYIHYNPTFMDNLKTEESSWFNLGVFAHEIGHHVNGHSIDIIIQRVAGKLMDDMSKETSRRQELEADEFSGFVLQKLGATLEQAKTAVNLSSTIEKDDTYSTHPSRSKRFEAVEKGWEKAQNQSGSYTKSLLLLPPEDYYYRGVERLEIGDYQRAVDDFTVSLEIDSTDEFAYYNRGNAYFKLKNYSQAIMDFSSAIDLDNNNDSYHFQRGNAYKMLSYKKAINDYSKAININDSKSEYYLNRAIAKYELKNFDSLWSELHASEISYDKLKVPSDDLGVIDDLKKSISLDKFNSEAYSYLGNTYYYMDDFVFAIKYINTGILVNENDAILYLDRANINTDILIRVLDGTYSENFIRENNININEESIVGDYKKAIDIYNKINNNNLHKIYNSLGDFYYWISRFKNYETNINLAIKNHLKAKDVLLKNGENVPAYIYESLSYDYEGFEDRFIDRIVYLSITYEKTGRKDLLNQISEVKIATEEYSSALEDIENLIDDDPNYYSPYMNRAKIRIDQADYSGAISDATKAISLAQDGSFIYYAYYLRGLAKINIKEDPCNDFSRVGKIMENDYYVNSNQFQKLRKKYCK